MVSEGGGAASRRVEAGAAARRKEKRAAAPGVIGVGNGVVLVSGWRWLGVGTAARRVEVVRRRWPEAGPAPRR